MIYLVEDDNSIRELVIYTLKQSGYAAEGFSVPSAFWNALKHTLPDMILLDIMLPEEDGLSILKKLRTSAVTRELPIIMLTAKSNEYDRVVGLDMGADDYVPKPFGMMELLSRIKALYRRCGKTEAPKTYSIGCLTVCPSKHIVRVNGQDIILTLKEFELLCLLLENQGVVLNRDQILNKIWGYAFDGESLTVDVHIRTLRQKLGQAGDLVETIRGIGYKIGDKREK